MEGLAKSYATLEAARTKVRESLEAERLARRPEAADKYDVPAVAGVSPEFLASHPLLPVLRDVAFDNALDAEGFKGLTEKVVTALQAAAPKVEEEMGKLGENAELRVQGVRNFVISQFPEGTPEFEALALVGTTAAGVKALEKLQQMAAGSTPPSAQGTPAPVAGGKTKADIMKMMDDRRYHDPRHRDPAFVKEVTDWWAANPNG